MAVDVEVSTPKFACCRAGQAKTGRARKNVAVGHTPVRVVESIKRLKPELNRVAFFIRHPKLLVYLGIEADDPGPELNCAQRCRTVPEELRRRHPDSSIG